CPVLECGMRIGPLEKLERQEPRTLPAFAPLFHGGIEKRLQLFRTLQQQRKSCATGIAQRLREEPCAFVVEARHRHQIESIFAQLLRHRALQPLELRRGRRRKLAGEPDITARTHPRPELRLFLRFPGGRRTLELDDVSERELIERGTIARALLQIEEREPGKGRELCVVIVKNSLLEEGAGL